MEVLNARAALLSNHEVLTLLRELDSAHIARAKTAVRIKQEDPARPQPAEEVCENLRTVEVEAISYLTAAYLPTPTQTDASVAKLTKALAPYALTKAEKLQVVNLAPTEPVELYVASIVEELEDRLGEHMDDILNIVRASVAKPPATNPSRSRTVVAEHVFAEEEQQDGEWVADADGEGEFFDDTGEGAGVEGDLDMEED
ncbi:hypothetical protein HWV62_33209 [Athelia sp. TMB]|nr:hypothetical protein HWV62_33209 [Athelia sp. TMB]